MIARVLKARLQGSSLTSGAYVTLRDHFHRVRKLKLFVRDARQTLRDMRWKGGPANSYWVLSAELLFQYHKLEKGLSMPGSKRFFGYDPATATLQLLERWRALGFPQHSRVYRGAIATLHAYRRRLDTTPPERGALLLQRLDAALSAVPEPANDVRTPMPARGIVGAAAAGIADLEGLALARRSVRSFAATAVERASIERAVSLAQLSPSACNRQPWRVHVYTERAQIDAMLALQDGNRGFGHTIPVLLILSADSRCFFDASERYEPYVDGGLFAMSLILALQAQGVSSCCLNWCVESRQDEAAHRMGGLDPAERIVMFMAVGHAHEDAVVPRSPRRPIDDVLSFHSNDI